MAPEFILFIKQKNSCRHGLFCKNGTEIYATGDGVISKVKKAKEDMEITLKLIIITDIRLYMLICLNIL